MKVYTSLNRISMAALAVALTPLAATAQSNISFPYNATGSFAFSDNSVLAYQLMVASVGAVAPATIVTGTDDSWGDVTGVPYATYSAGVSAPITSYSVDASNDLAGINSAGGYVETAPHSTTARGGTLVVNNLSYDAGTNTIYADVSGVNAAGTYTLTNTREQLFSVNALDYSTDGGNTWNSIVAPSANGKNPGPVKFAMPTNLYTLDVPDTQLYLRASGLFLIGGNTGTAFNQFEQSLGLQGLGLTLLKSIDTFDPNANTAGFGSLTVVLGVPEPTTYVFFGAGILGLALASRGARRATNQRQTKARAENFLSSSTLSKVGQMVGFICLFGCCFM